MVSRSSANSLASACCTNGLSDIQKPAMKTSLYSQNMTAHRFVSTHSKKCPSTASPIRDRTTQHLWKNLSGRWPDFSRLYRVSSCLRVSLASITLRIGWLPTCGRKILGQRDVGGRSIHDRFCWVSGDLDDHNTNRDGRFEN